MRHDALKKAYLDVIVASGAVKKEPLYLDLAATPGRVAKMLEGELLSSYRDGALEDLLGRFTTFPAMGKQEMVIESRIPFISMCAHHMLPFVGEACVGYIPGKRIVGLSKIPRVIDFFSHKFQIQERMTSEIADFLWEHLKPRGVIVLLEARHLCMEARGVRKPGVMTTTSALRGLATRGVVKSEFLAIISRKSSG